MMIKLDLFIILVTFSTSTNILLCDELCSDYDDKNCVHPNAIKNGHFINQWSVHLPGTTKEQARLILEANGFNYLGQIMDGVDLYLVTKKGTPEKHAMPNEKVIELLKKHKKVHSVAQTHVLQDSKSDYMFNIIEGNEVECLSLDPHSIKLNDGSENLKRIQNNESTEEDTEFPTSTMSRPISSNHVSDIEDSDQNWIFDYYQMDDSYDTNANGIKKRKRLYDEDKKNKSEESNNEESSSVNINESTEGEIETLASTMSKPVSSDHKSDAIDTNQTNDSYDNNINGKKKRKRHYDEEMKNKSEQLINKESSNNKE